MFVIKIFKKEFDNPLYCHELYRNALTVMASMPARMCFTVTQFAAPLPE